MIRAASRDDLPSIRELLTRSSHAPYEIAVVAEEKCFGAGFAGPANPRLHINDGEIAGLSVICGKYLRLLAVDPAHRNRGVGSQLLADAEKSGASVVAAEPGNYFTPGVVDTDRITIEFLKKRGYEETAFTHNLEAKLSGGQAPTPVQGGSNSGTKATGEGARPPLPLRTETGSTQRVLAFIEKEFGKIWRFEASRALENTPPTLFHIEIDGEIAGFSAHEANNRGLASFGPTGVARKMRNRGLGRHLLLSSLADLHRLGYTRVTIPWTDALDFYRKSCGAEPAFRFLTLSKSIVSRT